MNNEKTLKKLYENYENIEKSIVSQLLLDTPNHQLTAGTYREEVWKDLFEQIIPKKFCIDQGVFIIDSYGKISDEVDLAIFDEQYTPYIFNYGKVKFIPIEAVAVVIQCKSNKLVKGKLKKWIDSIDGLTTSLNSVARIVSGLVYNDINISKHVKSQTSTRPIKILCTTNSNKKGVGNYILNLFDICISIDKSKQDLKKEMLKEEATYYEWYEELNHFKLDKFDENESKYRSLMPKSNNIEGKKLSNIKVTGVDNNENVILSLIFQLNQLLMLINNPMLFPHEAYANLFNEIGDMVNEKYI